VFTSGGVPWPLSVTVQVRFPFPLASATVLYFRPCKAVRSASVVFSKIWVVPSASQTVMNDGIPVTLYVSVCVDSFVGPGLYANPPIPSDTDVVLALSSFTVIGEGAVPVQTGMSFTLVTSTVITLALASMSTPPLAVPPSSATWNVKLAYPAPLASATGVNCSFPAVMSATDTSSPAPTAALSSVRLPTDGSVVIFTRSNSSAPALLPASVGSLKPKSDAVNVYVPSSNTVTVLSVPCGASFTEVTVILAAVAVPRPTPRLVTEP